LRLTNIDNEYRIQLEKRKEQELKKLKIEQSVDSLKANVN